MSQRASNLLLRAAVAGIMAMLIGAPTPGYVSGCSSSDQAGAVDAEEFCNQYENRVCAREHAAQRIDDAQHEICLQQIPGRCSGFNFSPGCEPTEASIRACYAALIDGSRVAIPDPELPECQALCNGSGGGSEPEGI